MRVGGRKEEEERKDRMYEDGGKHKMHDGSDSEREKITREGHGSRPEPKGREKKGKMQRRWRQGNKRMAREHKTEGYG